MAATATTPPRRAALDALRGTLVPQTVGTVPGAEAYVTGMTAGTTDFNDADDEPRRRSSSRSC